MIKKYIIYPIQYLFFLLIYCFFKIMPSKFASNFGGNIFKILGPFSNTHKIIKSNLNQVFKNKNTSITSNIEKKCWENLGRTIAELPHLHKITRIKNKNIEVSGSKFLNKIIEKNEQAIFIAIHQSNWEILAPILISYGIKLNTVYRHINNLLIDRFILNIRKKAYSSKISKLSPKGKKSAQDMIKSIKNGYSIALLVDQKDSSGLTVPLLEKNSKTQTGFLKLSKKFNLKIYPIENKRINNTRFKIIIHKPIDFFNNKKKYNEKTAMIHIHKMIGKWIIKNPENWLWQHKRWD